MPTLRFPDGTSFLFQWPTFILIEGSTVRSGAPLDTKLYNPVTLTGADAPAALVLFDERPAAEIFRDGHAKWHEPHEIANASELHGTLTAAKAVAEVVVLNPHTLGRQVQVIPIDDLIRWCADQLANPGSSGDG